MHPEHESNQTERSTLDSSHTGFVSTTLCEKETYVTAFIITLSVFGALVLFSYLFVRWHWQERLKRFLFHVQYRYLPRTMHKLSKFER